MMEPKLHTIQRVDGYGTISTGLLQEELGLDHLKPGPIHCLKEPHPVSSSPSPPFFFFFSMGIYYHLRTVSSNAGQ